MTSKTYGSGNDTCRSPGTQLPAIGVSTAIDATRKQSRRKSKRSKRRTSKSSHETRGTSETEKTPTLLELSSSPSARRYSSSSSKKKETDARIRHEILGSRRTSIPLTILKDAKATTVKLQKPDAEVSKLSTSNLQRHNFYGEEYKGGDDSISSFEVPLQDSESSLTNTSDKRWHLSHALAAADLNGSCSSILSSGTASSRLSASSAVNRGEMRSMVESIRRDRERLERRNSERVQQCRDMENEREAIAFKWEVKNSLRKLERRNSELEKLHRDLEDKRESTLFKWEVTNSLRNLTSKSA